MKSFLSKQEAIIFLKYKEGLRGKEIAEEMGISQKTVGTYFMRIRKKCGVHPEWNLYKAINEIDRILKRYHRKEKLFDS